MFNIGDKIVYPMHGAGIIDNIEVREILGEKKEYYIMKMPIGDIKIMIPVENQEEIGIRNIINDDEIQELVRILQGDKTTMHQNWNKRYRANMEKIKSGDVYEIAGVVRNLSIRDSEKGLSTGERKMLNSAKQMLVSEIVLVTEMELEEVEELIEESINFS